MGWVSRFVRRLLFDDDGNGGTVAVAATGDDCNSDGNSRCRNVNTRRRIRWIVVVKRRVDGFMTQGNPAREREKKPKERKCSCLAFNLVVRVCECVFLTS